MDPSTSWEDGMDCSAVGKSEDSLAITSNVEATFDDVQFEEDLVTVMAVEDMGYDDLQFADTSGDPVSVTYLEDAVYGEEPLALGVAGDSDDSGSDSEDPAEYLEVAGDSKDKEKELTNKFLSGELSFSEYAALTEGDDVEEAVEERPPVLAGDAGRGRRRRRRHLPPALKGLMGEANLRYARGDRDTAVALCMEVIRRVPTAPDPFQMLAMLYEEKGSPEKSLQFALIAAHLDPADPEQWARLAAMSEDQGDRRQAATCLTRAIKADPTSVELHARRARLLEDLGDHKQANRAYLRLLTVLPPDRGADVLDVARTLALRHHEAEEPTKALEAMELAFAKCPACVTAEEVNMLLELLLLLKRYRRCLEVLSLHCRVQWRSDLVAPELQANFTVLSCLVPPDLPLDLRAKLAVVLVHLRAWRLVDEVVDALHARSDPEHDGDLYLDVAEALIAEGRHADALRLTQPLVEGTKYSLPAVWLRHAESLLACERLQEAAVAYQELVARAPRHLEARLTLASLLSRLGSGDRALEVLTQDPDRETLDPGLLYERCLLLRDAGRDAELLSVGQLLLSRHCVCIRNREELSVLCRLRHPSRKKNALHEVRRARGEPQTDPGVPDFREDKDTPTVEQEWALLQQLCTTCLRLQRTDLLQRLAFSALGSTRFLADPTRAAEVEFLCLLSCLHNEDTFNGYRLVRNMVMWGTTNRRTWNLFNQVIQRADHVRQNRFFIRLMMRFLDHEGLLTLHANSCLVAGTYKYALVDYVSAFRVRPTPLVALLMGVTLFQISCQKFTARKSSLVVQGLAFFDRYRQLRGPEGRQEVCYNIGRAFHQLGLFPAAVQQYERVLEFNSSLTEQFPNLVDLKREAAFNLHLIYKNSKSPALANMYLQKYVVI